MRNVSISLLRYVVGIKIEVRGLHNINKKPCLIASKHQSGIETIGVFDTVIPNLSYVLKQELARVPFAGRLLKINKSISVDRKKGGNKAFIEMLRLGQKVLKDESDPRHILIFPEGTRNEYGKPTILKFGIAKMYDYLKVPVQPVALSTGFFWQKGRFTMYPGTAIIEFLPVIPEGLNSDEMLEKLANELHNHSEKLALENCPKFLKPDYKIA